MLEFKTKIVFTVLPDLSNSGIVGVSILSTSIETLLDKFVLKISQHKKTIIIISVQ